MSTPLINVLLSFQMVQRQEEVLREQQEEQRKENQEMMKLATIEEMKARVPVEPGPNCGEPVSILICDFFRSNSRLNRELL